MIYKTGWFDVAGGGTDPLDNTVDFTTDFPSADYEIFLSEAVLSGDPISDINPASLRADLQSTVGFRVTRGYVSTDPAAAIRVYWLALMFDAYEGTLEEIP